MMMQKESEKKKNSGVHDTVSNGIYNINGDDMHEYHLVGNNIKGTEREEKKIMNMKKPPTKLPQSA